jgi:anti-anti-sigma factor
MLIDHKNTIIGIFMSYNKVRVLELFGKIEFQTCHSLRCQMMEIVQTKPDILVLDFGDVSYVDCRGLDLLIEILKAMNAFGGKLVLANINSQVDMLLDISETRQYFEFCDRA